MAPFRWLGEKLGLVQSAEDQLLTDAATKIAALAAVSRAQTRFGLETHLRELEASGQAELAEYIRNELEASGLTASVPPGQAVAAALPESSHLALPAAPTASTTAIAVTPAPRRRGRPRKGTPSPADSFRPETPS